MRSSDIQKSLIIELLFLQIKRFQRRWVDHVSRIPLKRLPYQALLAKANGRRPVGQPKTRWTNYIENLRWNRLGLHPSENMDGMEDRDVWQLISSCYPRNPYGEAGNEEKRRKKRHV